MRAKDIWSVAQDISHSYNYGIALDKVVKDPLDLLQKRWILMSKTKTNDSVTNAVRIATPRIRPLDNRIVVRADDPAKVSKGGIHLPGNSQEKPQKGEVLAVGPGRLSEHTGERMKMVIKVGDVVLFQRWAGNNVQDIGDDVLVLREDEVLGVLE